MSSSTYSLLATDPVLTSIFTGNIVAAIANLVVLAVFLHSRFSKLKKTVYKIFLATILANISANLFALTKFSEFFSSSEGAYAFLTAATILLFLQIYPLFLMGYAMLKIYTVLDRFLERILPIFFYLFTIFCTFTFISFLVNYSVNLTYSPAMAGEYVSGYIRGVIYLTALYSMLAFAFVAFLSISILAAILVQKLLQFYREKRGNDVFLIRRLYRAIALFAIVLLLVCSATVLSINNYLEGSRLTSLIEFLISPIPTILMYAFEISIKIALSRKPDSMMAIQKTDLRPPKPLMLLDLAKKKTEGRRKGKDKESVGERGGVRDGGAASLAPTILVKS